MESPISCKKCKNPVGTAITKIYVSETINSNCFDYDACLSQIRKIFNFGMPQEIFANFVVTGDGSVFEGLIPKCPTNHYRSVDIDSLHVMFAANSNSADDKINDLQYRSLYLMIKAYIIIGEISSLYTTGSEFCRGIEKTYNRDLYETLSQSDHFMSECNKTEQCLLLTSQ